MEYWYPQLFALLSIAAFILTVMMHVTRKNMSLATFYLIQSGILVVVLLITATSEYNSALLSIALLTFIVKVCLTPYFFYRMIHQVQSFFTSSAYLGIPLSFLVILFLSLFLSPQLNTTLSGIGSTATGFGGLSIAISGMLISLFLIVNRKDMVAQIIGILSLENWIVFAGSALGVTHSFALELGITFDILMWVLIAVAFIGMVHRSFGTLDVAQMSELKEE